ncbi:MAG: cysteine hydrolase [Proteobacteria bacterium]|nr:cysteine hydrolase [Pseudomonadota bacterium]
MKNALLVIDAQQIYADLESDLFVENYAAVMENINKLITRFAANGDSVIYIKHIHKANGTDAGRMFDFAGPSDGLQFVEGTDEAEFIPELNVIPVAPVIIKNRYSSFVNTDLDNFLKSRGVEKITICGFMTNFCCEATARHAHDLDYFVDFIADATGTPGTDDLSPADTIVATCATLAAGVAAVKTTKEII